MLPLQFRRLEAALRIPRTPETAQGQEEDCRFFHGQLKDRNIRRAQSVVSSPAAGVGHSWSACSQDPKSAESTEGSGVLVCVISPSGTLESTKEGYSQQARVAAGHSLHDPFLSCWNRVASLLVSMDFATAVSSPSKNLISMLNDADLTPRPLRINKRKRQVCLQFPIDDICHCRLTLFLGFGSFRSSGWLPQIIQFKHRRQRPLSTVQDKFASRAWLLSRIPQSTKAAAKLHGSCGFGYRQCRSCS